MTMLLIMLLICPGNWEYK